MRGRGASRSLGESRRPGGAGGRGQTERARGLRNEPTFSSGSCLNGGGTGPRELVPSLDLTGRSGGRGRSRPSGADQGPFALRPRKLDECFERLTPQCNALLLELFVFGNSSEWVLAAESVFRKPPPPYLSLILIRGRIPNLEWDQ